jgi:hypothetical protein
MWNGSKVVAELHAARTKVGFARGEVATMNSAKTFSDASVSRQAGLYVAGLVFLTLLGSGGLYAAWQPVPVADDPLVRMPGTQPEEGVNVEAPNRCLNCHAGYNEGAEPGYNWIGSMMAQAARDPIFPSMCWGIQTRRTCASGATFPEAGSVGDQTRPTPPR